MRAPAVILLLAGPLAALAATGADKTLVPGLLGYNALPSLPLADAQVGDDLQVEVGAATQLSDFAGSAQAAFTPWVRLTVPFRSVAALDVEAAPVEVWGVDAATQQRLGALHGNGVTKGDLRFGARFTLLAESGAWPALGLRLVTKTASGKGLEDRRFLDAPAYQGDALVSKTLPGRLGPFDTIRLAGGLGLLVWQQGSGWQDDALTAALRLQLATPRRVRLEVEARGYFGYEVHDKPVLLGVTFGDHLLDALEVVGTLNRGFADAPPWEVRLGLVLHVYVAPAP